MKPTLFQVSLGAVLGTLASCSEPLLSAPSPSSPPTEAAKLSAFQPVAYQTKGTQQHRSGNALFSRKSTKEVAFIPSSPSTFVIEVERNAGTCPETVGLVTSARSANEISAENTVIADTSAIAEEPAKLVSSSSPNPLQFVQYQATLKKSYASCIGEALSAANPAYYFQFRNGKVYFSVDLRRLDNAGILEHKVFDKSPYVRWAFSE